jgi:hypothetical protein
LFQVRLEEYERSIQSLQASLQRQTLDADRRLTKQQQLYERKVQALMHQITIAQAQEVPPSAAGDSDGVGSGGNSAKSARGDTDQREAK